MLRARRFLRRPHLARPAYRAASSVLSVSNNPKLISVLRFRARGPQFPARFLFWGKIRGIDQCRGGDVHANPAKKNMSDNLDAVVAL
jgi:hypothetical protein